MDAFIGCSEQWVVEGCYTGLISHFLSKATQLIFMNLGVETCITNCRARPWESHKYASKEEQDERLGFLLEWVKEYETREDEFSLEAHQSLFDQFTGSKLEVESNEEGEALKQDFEKS
ncbi:MAG: hypothetical protein P8L44_07675 [Opitutales bacterium]|jgi:hypothetical protein|nr:hypothetical protein [Opitutales bacterium]